MSSFLDFFPYIVSAALKSCHDWYDVNRLDWEERKQQKRSGIQYSRI